ncbi:uncharacterized protein [Pocillopora verrucosa]|uniref:uncharacterized protein n=1 Tax=Pocillopora verrucosa TaxID=203993 RepID=UPI002797BEE4|nr:uncharacterized protein LOC131797016 [Pocillopora verrucosa]
MLTSRCIRSISKLSSSARLVRHASRLQQGSCKEGINVQIGLLGRSSTGGQCLAAQGKFGKRFTRSIYATTVAADFARIPEMMANSLIEAAGVDAGVADDDDEMTSSVKKGKHRRINCGWCS